MQLSARISLVTLACRDVARLASLFGAIGWPRRPRATSTTGRFVHERRRPRPLLRLRATSYAATSYEPELGPPTTTFRGVTLCVNVASFEACEAIHSALRTSRGRRAALEPERAPGRGFSWRDPEGNGWDVASAQSVEIDDRGDVTLP